MPAEDSSQPGPGQGTFSKMGLCFHGQAPTSEALNSPAAAASPPQLLWEGEIAQAGQIQQKIQRCLPHSPPPVQIPNQPAQISLEVKQKLPVNLGDIPSPLI